MRRRMAATARATLAGVVAVFVCFLIASLFGGEANADLRGVRTIVLYSEGVAVVQADVRRAVPEAYVVLDPSDYRAALAAKGAPPPIAKALGAAKTRTGVLEKARAAGDQVHADVVVLLIATQTKLARFTRILVLDPKSEEPLLDTAVQLSKSNTPTAADVQKIKAKIGPLLEQIAKPPEQPEAGPDEASSSNPFSPFEDGGTGAVVADAGAPPADASADAAADAEPSGPPVSADFVIRSFPVGGLDNSMIASVAVPLTRSFYLVPLLGGGYETPVNGGQTDLYYVVGGGTRFILTPAWVVEAVGFYAAGSQYVHLYRGIAGTAVTLSPAVRLGVSFSAARVMYFMNLGPRDSEIISGNVSLDGRITLGKVWFTPSTGYFLYDRALINANGGLGVLARGYAPYPIRTWIGTYIGYDTGRISPYIGARQWFYAADLGLGTSFGLGVRLKSGSDYIDVRGGLFLSNGQGPQADVQRDKVPVFNVEAGWAF